MTHFRIIDLIHVMLPGQEQYTVEIKQRGEPRITPTGDFQPAGFAPYPHCVYNGAR